MTRYFFPAHVNNLEKINPNYNAPVLILLTICSKRAIMCKTAKLKRLNCHEKFSGIGLATFAPQQKGGTMELKQFLAGSIGKRQAVYMTLLALGFSGCAATTSDSTYAYRNNIDAARSRCVELARTSGYPEVAVDSVERDGQADWKVELIVKKDGKNRKERCEYNANTNRVRMDS